MRESTETIARPRIHIDHCPGLAYDDSQHSVRGAAARRLVAVRSLSADSHDQRRSSQLSIDSTLSVPAVQVLVLPYCAMMETLPVLG